MATLIIPEQPHPSISQIIKPSGSSGGLYLGNYQAACNKQLLKNLKITAVITLGKDMIPPQGKGISTLLIQIEDNPLSDLLNHLPKCVKFIQENIKFGKVFVHCRAGISRSATVVIAFLMCSRNYSLEKALRRTKEKREIVNPNAGFLMQLEVYQSSLKGKGNEKYGLSLEKAVISKSCKKENKLTKERNCSSKKMAIDHLFATKTLPLRNRQSQTKVKIQKSNFFF